MVCIIIDVIYLLRPVLGADAGIHVIVSLVMLRKDNSNLYFVVSSNIIIKFDYT